MKKILYKEKKFNKIIFIAFFAVLLFSSSFSFAHAAKLSVEGRTEGIVVGEQYTVNVLLDTEGASINAISGGISFPQDTLGFQDVRDGNSVVNFWIEKPEVKQPGTVSFSGIIPGGYQGAKGFVFSIVFSAKTSQTGTLLFQNMKVLLNDGKGTQADTKTLPFQFVISEPKAGVPALVPNPDQTSPAQVSDTPQFVVDDTTPPESFNPEIEQASSIFDGKYFLVFATQDKESGIDHYEVCEGSRSSCVTATNPYLLQNQNLDEQIFVKAVDNNGNERTIVLPPQNPKSSNRDDLIAALLLALFVLLLSIFVRSVVRFHKDRRDRRPRV